MIEVAIAAVEAVFDWKKFLIEEFNYDPSYFEEDVTQDEIVTAVTGMYEACYKEAERI